MFKIDNTTLRNLEEQVQYLTDYHKVNQGIAQWGIKVVGQVETEDELPTPATYQGDYGDTYAVGTEAPFNFYIWTRSSIEGIGYWFPFGEISIVGPEGPQGDKGDKGDTGHSTMWYAGSLAPYPYPQYVEGDMYLQTSGQVYRYQNNSWQNVANIKGPQGARGLQGIQGLQGLQGPQGPKGDTGDVGGFINIWGILQNTDQLPTPESLNNPTVAYLIEHTGGDDQANDHYDLYIQVGETASDRVWTNAGPFNAATLVTVNGSGQNVWNADTKVDVDKVATSDELGLVKMTPRSGAAIILNSNNQLQLNAANQTQIEADEPSSQTPITARNIQFAVKRGLVNPVGGIERVGWTDEDKATACENIGASKKPTATELGLNAYGVVTYLKNSEGIISSKLQYISSAQGHTPNRLPTYGFNGQLLVYTDEDSNAEAATNKQYVETNFSKKLYKHNLVIIKSGITPIMFSVISSIPRNQLETVGLNNEDGFITGAGLRAFLAANELNEEGIKCAGTDIHGIPIMIVGDTESTTLWIPKLSVYEGEIRMFTEDDAIINPNDQLELYVTPVEL